MKANFMVRVVGSRDDVQQARKRGLTSPELYVRRSRTDVGPSY